MHLTSFFLSHNYLFFREPELIEMSFLAAMRYWRNHRRRPGRIEIGSSRVSKRRLGSKKLGELTFRLRAETGKARIYSLIQIDLLNEHWGGHWKWQKLDVYVHTCAKEGTEEKKRGKKRKGDCVIVICVHHRIHIFKFYRVHDVTTDSFFRTLRDSRREKCALRLNPGIVHSLTLINE